MRLSLPLQSAGSTSLGTFRIWLCCLNICSLRWNHNRPAMKGAFHAGLCWKQTHLVKCQDPVQTSRMRTQGEGWSEQAAKEKALQTVTAVGQATTLGMSNRVRGTGILSGARPHSMHSSRGTAPGSGTGTGMAPNEPILRSRKGHSSASAVSACGSVEAQTARARSQRGQVLSPAQRIALLLQSTQRKSPSTVVGKQMGLQHDLILLCQEEEGPPSPRSAV